MLSFIGRRFLVAIPTLLLVVTLAFFMMRAAPGGPFDMDRKLSPAIEKNLEARYGLNKPLPQQYLDYLVGVVHGDLGPSLKYKDKTVLQILKENYPVSLRLGGSAILLAGVLGVSLGVLAALRQNGVADEGVPFREIAGGIGRRLNVPVVSRTSEEAAGHFGWIAPFVTMDGPASSAQTQERLGWHSTGSGFIADIDGPAYF